MRPLLLATLLLAPGLGLAGKDDDAPIPFPDEQSDPGRELPASIDERRPVREETEEELLERERSLAGFDDPNIGLSGELVAGLMLLDSSRGAGVDTRAAWGLRFVWEFGRLLPDETLRDALFADLTWSYAGLRDGTTQVYADSNYHFFTLAPAYAFVLGDKSPYSVYAQAGIGLGYGFSALHVKEVETQISGTKALLQYGVGFRGRPAIVADQSIRLSFRVEVTRFRRGYLDDTFLGGSVGATF